MRSPQGPPLRPPSPADRTTWLGSVCELQRTLWGLAVQLPGSRSRVGHPRTSQRTGGGLCLTSALESVFCQLGPDPDTHARWSRSPELRPLCNLTVLLCGAPHSWSSTQKRRSPATLFCHTHPCWSLSSGPSGRRTERNNNNGVGPALLGSQLLPSQSRIPSPELSACQARN